MMIKYPRTAHIESSRKQPGDEDLDAVPFAEIKGRFLVVEEKVDGANTAISFDNGVMMLQSRGHYLIGNDHRQFDMFKSWAFSIQNQIYAVLGDRYIMYGEWVFAKHTVFYDALPHYFLEFDIFDKELGVFLSTQMRHDMLDGLGVVSVPVLEQGAFDCLESLVALVGDSAFKTEENQEQLVAAAQYAKLDSDQVVSETDSSLLMEGLYIKDETSGIVDERYKWVRADFLQTIKDSGSHWMKRPIVPNVLAPGVDIFG